MVRTAKPALIVYDLQGERIGKGKFHSTSDVSLQLDKNGNYVTIPLINIGTIKTTHSPANGIIIGGAIGITTFGLIAASDDRASGTYFREADIAIAGGLLGAIVGGILTAAKKSIYYEINGDPEKWKVFREAVLIK
jgi:hypothetical protein